MAFISKIDFLNCMNVMWAFQRIFFSYMMIFSEPVFKIFETVKSKVLNIAIIYISDFYIQFIILLIECQNFKIVVLLIKAVVYFNFSVQIKIRYLIYTIFFFLLYFFLYFILPNFFYVKSCLLNPFKIFLFSNSPVLFFKMKLKFANTTSSTPCFFLNIFLLFSSCIFLQVRLKQPENSFYQYLIFYSFWK